MKRQKGQVIIEFALILPLFIILLFGIIYCGMLFYDYITLSNIARSAAREAAIVQTLDDTQKSKIENYYTKKMSSLLTSLYTPSTDPSDPTSTYTIKVYEDYGEDGTPNTDDDGVAVRIIMQRNVSSTLMEMMLPDGYKIEYFMRRDEQSTTTTTNNNS